MRSRRFFRHILGFVPSVSVAACGRDADDSCLDALVTGELARHVLHAPSVSQ